MKTQLKKFVERTVNNPIAWFAYRTCGMLSAYLGKIYGHALLVKKNAAQEEKLTRVLGDLFPDLTVTNGPFKGMRYPAAQSCGSALLPKLLGSYESELHPALERLLANHYTTIVDIGCAEGYYAVGLGLKLPHANIYAFDTSPEARRACAEMAKLNGVADRVHIAGFCDEKMLRAIPLGTKALIISDCEGYEGALFNSELAQFLAMHDLIIEAHDFIDIEISPKLRSAFAKTHDIQSIKSIDDIERAHTYRYPELENYTTDERRLILSEKRPAIMEWLVMTMAGPNSRNHLSS